MRTYTIKVNADDADKENVSGMLLSLLDSLNIGYTIKSEPKKTDESVDVKRVLLFDQEIKSLKKAIDSIDAVKHYAGQYAPIHSALIDLRNATEILRMAGFWNKKANS